MNDRLIEVSIMVYNPVCILSKELGSTIKIKDIRSYGGQVAHLIELSQDKFVHAREIAKKIGCILRGVKTTGGSTTCWFFSDGCDACRPIALGESFLVKGRLLDDGSMEFNFIAPGEDSYGKILDELSKNDIKFDIVRITGFKSNKWLTQNQEKILYIAYKMGLFDHPRRTSIKELSEMLGIKPSSLSESLRRSLKRLVMNYFK